MQKNEKHTSIITTKLEDSFAIYVSPEKFAVKGDGIHDDTQGLQQAINLAKETYGFGIVFLPEGTYKITDTLYIPKAIRLIGYGKERPVIQLEDYARGFDQEDLQDKGQAKYAIWFVDQVPKQGEEIHDANPGTFYSALSNVDVKLGTGNPAAIGLRTHYAQHCFISHVCIDATGAKAGMFDMGNEMSDVHITGGDYGIITTKCSPGWPFVMVDTSFENQTKAAIRTHEGGLTILRTHISNTPIAIATDDGFIEKIYLEDSVLEQISEPAIQIPLDDNTMTQFNLRNVVCCKVEQLAITKEQKTEIAGLSENYIVRDFTYGYQMTDVDQKAEYTYHCILEPVEEQQIESVKLRTLQSDLPSLGDSKQWVNLNRLGAIGDGKTDNTAVIQAAIEQYDTIYVPQGWYVVTDTIHLKRDTRLIGLNPISTQFILPDHTEGFCGIGKPKALLEVPEGGDNIVNGIGLNAGSDNYRAVGCKWMAGEHSYMNDVKFLGGHGTMNWGEQGWSPVYNASRTADVNPERTWDSCMWSLWITNGGGGIFKDIWSASPYASAGLYVSNTTTPGKIYCMSLEHHVRAEARFSNVANWSIYGLQTEEEVAESPNCQPLELQNCENLLFANLYMFRVVWVATPHPHAIRTLNCRNLQFLNVHNFAQMKYVMDNLLLDVNTGHEVRPWELASLHISGDAGKKKEQQRMKQLATGFQFADGGCCDQAGNFYFIDGKLKRIYRIDAITHALSLVVDFPYKPDALAFDTKGNLLVVVDFTYPLGATENGVLIDVPMGADSWGSSYFYYYSRRSVTRVYAMNPEHPEDTIQELSRVAREEYLKKRKPEVVYYPANRWRDGGDYLTESVRVPKDWFVAPDGVTVLPDQYDLMRCCSLSKAVPGEVHYGVDELFKRVISFETDENGALSNPKPFARHGEFCVVRHENLVYICESNLFVYDLEGNLVEEIEVPERPTTVAFGGVDHKTMFVATRHGIYMRRRDFEE